MDVDPAGDVESIEATPEEVVLPNKDRAGWISLRVLPCALR